MRSGWTIRGMKRPQRTKSISSVRVLERGFHGATSAFSWPRRGQAYSAPVGQAYEKRPPVDHTSIPAWRYGLRRMLILGKKIRDRLFNQSGDRRFLPGSQDAHFC